MLKRREIGWWYWLVMAALLGLDLFKVYPAIGLAVLLGWMQMLHYAWRSQSAVAFPLQLRVGYLILLLVGLCPLMGWVHWVQLVGTSLMVVTAHCPLARIMSLLPWNRTRPLTAGLVRQAIFNAGAQPDGECA